MSGSLRFGNVRLSYGGLTASSNVKLTANGLVVGGMTLSSAGLSARSQNVVLSNGQLTTVADWGLSQNTPSSITILNKPVTISTWQNDVGYTIANANAGFAALLANTLTTSNVATLRQVVANGVSANHASLSNLSVSNVTAANVIQANTISALTMSSNVISLSAASSFTGSYTTLSNTPVLPSIADYGAVASTASNLAVINKPLLSVINQTASVLNTKMYTAIATSASNGTVVFYPTVTGAAGSTSLFSQILTIQGSLWLNTSTATSVPNIAGKSISADLSTVVFNLTVGSTAGIVGGGASAVFAGSGIPCMCLVLGV